MLSFQRIKQWGALLALLGCSSIARAQSDTIYINGPYYVAAGASEQWYAPVVMGPLAELYIEDGAEILFYGASFKLEPGAKIYGADNAWTTFAQGAGTGSIVFQQANPMNGTTVQQTLDGGNSGNPANSTQNTFTSIGINNTSGVKLVNSDTRIGSAVTFTNGHLFLDTLNAVMSSAGSMSGYNNTMYVVTASTGHLVKESYSSAFVFPVGMAVGDYTPATVTPASPNTVHVNVTSYSLDTLTQINPDGMLRTWNIFGNNANGAGIALQHNSVTNQPQFLQNANFVTRYGTPPNSTGDNTSLSAWQSNAPGASTIVGGAETQSRAYASLATGANRNEAYFTKASNLIAPLPVILSKFTVEGNGCNVVVNWVAGTEKNVHHYEIQSSETGRAFFRTVASLPAVNKDGASYAQTIVQNEPAMLYRLKSVDMDGTYQVSPVLTGRTHCDYPADVKIRVSPNPATGMVTISNLSEGDIVIVHDMRGRDMLSVKATQGFVTINIRDYAAGAYPVTVYHPGTGKRQVARVVKIK